MSINTLMNHVAVVKRPRHENEVDAAGMPVHDPQTVLPACVGRLSRQSARQREMWAAQGVQADYAWITLEDSIENNWFIIFDGRTFVVTADGQKSYTEGRIPSHWNYPLTEMRA